MNTKLNNGTLSEISFGEIKTLFENNKDIVDFKEYFRSCIESILNGDKNRKLSKEDFELIKDFINSKREYKELLDKHALNQISYQILDVLITDKSLDDFLELFKNQNFRNNIHYLSVKKLKILLQLIKTSDDLIKLFKSEYFLADLGYFTSEKIKTLVYFSDDINDFTNYINNTTIFNFMLKCNDNVLDIIKNLCKTKSDFKKIFKTYSALNVLSNLNIDNFNFIISLYDIKNIDKLIKVLSKNYRFIDILKGPTFNFNFIINLFNINNVKDFEKLFFGFAFTDKKIKDIISADEYVLKFLINLFNIDNVDDLYELLENNNISSLLGANKENFSYLIKLYNIKTLDDIISLPKHQQFYHSNIILFFKDLPEEFSDKIKDFITYISKSKNDLLFLTNNKLVLNNYLIKIIKYFLLNKKPKELVKIFKRLDLLNNVGIDLGVYNLKDLEDFKDENGKIKFDELRKNFERIIKLNNRKKQDKLLTEFDNLVKWGNLNGLEKFLGDNLIMYFDKVSKVKIKSKILSDIKKSVSLNEEIDFSKIDISRIDNPIFLEAYLMSINPKFNKAKINQLLLDYLLGKFDNLNDLNQYKTEKNDKWLIKLSKKQKDIWLGENEENYDTSNINSSEDNINMRIKNHFSTALRKIKEINKIGFEFKTDFNNFKELKDYFDTEIKIKRTLISIKDKNNLFGDLELQIKEISRLERSKNQSSGKKITKVTIKRELDPLRCLMMGNWVEGSCLSYNNSIGNYYSSISNTIDVNKGVYYLYDQDGELIGRCLVTIGNDKKISRYKMYYTGNYSVPLDELFDDYVKKISKKMGLRLNGKEDNVENIESEYWYKDGIQKIK